ncbi:MAG: preprotein translocase subunit Sec61beta [Candidatus Diapherotrites archaeon]|uniref:Preprotein translocase subunit Sec61beta n=1 Tax=Candidatus Iainarchaeum sp. TaxID=3101447 RepID=A0A8T4L2K8_9ARCH|nr:preprotein translocase subunit Sec61beta [Candidatus Diapherotrites archaeon]
MVKLQQNQGAGGPSSSLGIMRFFDVETGGPKLSPQFVVGLSVAFVILIMVLRITIFKS